MARSFRGLTPQELHGIQEQRLRIVPARAGETLDQLLARTRSSWKMEEVAVANALPMNTRLKAGQLVKVAGYCVGSANITTSLTLRGGYTLTDWTTANGALNTTTSRLRWPEIAMDTTAESAADVMAANSGRRRMRSRPGPLTVAATGERGAPME